MPTSQTLMVPAHRRCLLMLSAATWRHHLGLAMSWKVVCVHFLSIQSVGDNRISIGEQDESPDADTAKVSSPLCTSVSPSIYGAQLRLLTKQMDTTPHDRTKLACMHRPSPTAFYNSAHTPSYYYSYRHHHHFYSCQGVIN